MKKALITHLAVVAAVLLGASHALACGTHDGYTYAGLASQTPAFGIAATVTPIGPFDIRAGHVAGWVGVGGPGAGPNGSDEWLQVGFSGFPALPGSDLYYELALPHGKPVYHQIGGSLPMGRPARLAVLEVGGRPGWWRVWVDGSPASPPIHLPASHGRWAPIATAESWDGGNAGACNGFLYRFGEVSIAGAPGGDWHPLRSAFSIDGTSSRVRREGTAAEFLAAEGDTALRLLASARG